MKSCPGTGSSKVFNNLAIKGLSTRPLPPLLSMDKALSQAESTICLISLVSPDIHKSMLLNMVSRGVIGHCNLLEVVFHKF